MIVSTCRVDVQRDLRRAYVLHITNLEDQAYEYQVTFVMTVLPGFWTTPKGSKDLEKHLAFTGTSYLTEQGFRRVAVPPSLYTAGGEAFSKKVRIWIGARQTGWVGMEPAVQPGGRFSMFRPRASSPLDNLEGYVSLSLPVRRPVRGRLLSEPQSLTPVRVLLNPETRTINRSGGQRMDIWEDDPPVSTGEFYPTVDPPLRQSGFTYVPAETIERIEPLHVATGKAENELTPDGGAGMTVESVRYALASLESDEPGDYTGAAPVAGEDRAGALLELLMDIGDDPEVARLVNQALERHQARVRLRQP